MVVETLWPENAPWWLNMFIWMATFWWYILIGFVPAFYIAVAKLFGMPLLQRWSQEVVIILYPSKVKFRKVTQQFEPYFRDGKGVYWMSNPLQPTPHEEVSPAYQERLDKIRTKYEALQSKETKTKKEEALMNKLLKEQMRIEKRVGRHVLTVNPINQLHIYTHAVNQPIYDMERRQSKVDEILNNNPTPRKIPGHGIWLMQNPRLHFHRHYQIVINPEGNLYKLIPVKERQQFSIGFWHSLGIVMQKEVKVEEGEKEIDSASGGGGKQLVQTVVTTHVVLQQMKEVQDYQNFSASRAYMLLKRRAKIEQGFIYWISGSINPMVLIVLMGAIAAVAAIFLFMHGQTPPSTPGGAPTSGVKIL